MSVKLTHPNLTTLQKNLTSYSVGLEAWFEIYRTIFSQLTPIELQQEIDRAIAKPIFVQKVGNNIHFLNNLLLLSAIVAQHPFTHQQHFKPLALFTLDKDSLEIGIIFYETIELIERQEKRLKKFHLELGEKIAKALTTEQCKALLDCNTLTQKRFLQLIHVSSSTAHRHKPQALG